MSAPLTAATRRNTPVARDELALAIDRAAGARPIGGNRLEHHPDSPRALAVMLEAIATARQTIHLENYIIRDDATGRRFAAALAERARAGVRKLLATDGTWAILGGLCIGDEWAGDPARKRRPWRDTMVAVSGPAVAALERAFARTWARAGAALPPDELVADPAPCGDSTVRIVEGVPQRARVYRTVQLLVASAAERLWITDAYLIAPAALYASLIDAAKAGVDVRLLVPGTTDLPVLRNFTRIGYRDMLHAGIRVFEYEGPMIHAKTMLVDHRWARVGSSNLNVSSLLTNYELDLAAECEGLTAELADQFRRDTRLSREIVLQARRRLLPPRLVDAPTTGAEVPPDTSHKRSGYELGAVAVVALRRVAGGLRRGIAATAALGSATVGVLLLVFPRIMGIVFAAGAFALALTFTLYGFELRRTRDADDG